MGRCLALRSAREEYGFDRVYRSSLGNVRAAVTVRVPVDAGGRPSLARQREIAAEHQSLVDAQAQSLTTIDSVLSARLTAASLAVAASQEPCHQPPLPGNDRLVGALNACSPLRGWLELASADD